MINIFCIMLHDGKMVKVKIFFGIDRVKFYIPISIL